MSWDDRWMSVAQLASTWSKDRSRKVGCVIVDDRNVLISIGWNGFPRGVDDTREEWHQRPLKYKPTEHSERNAIYNAAAKGIATAGSRMYVQWFPCADCARGIIQSGIVELVGFEPDWADQTYAADFAIAKEMLAQAGVKVRFIGKREDVRKEGVL